MEVSFFVNHGSQQDIGTIMPQKASNLIKGLSKATKASKDD